MKVKYIVCSYVVSDIQNHFTIYIGSTYSCTGMSVYHKLGLDLYFPKTLVSCIPLLRYYNFQINI